MPPIAFQPSLETTKPDEADIHKQMIETFAKIQATTLKDYGHAVRGVHAKAHGLLRGRIEVVQGLAAELAQGVFAAPGTYDVVMRFSTNPGDILDDNVSTPRGLALKIIGVTGERLPGADGTSQDFVLANSPAFSAPDAAAFLKNLKLLAATTDTPQVFKKGISALMRGIEALLESVGTKSATVVALGGQPATHILGETFYSQVPMRWGNHVAKVAIAPSSSALTALTGTKIDLGASPNALRELVTTFFIGQGGEWELKVQLLTDPDAMPIEDASVEWPQEKSAYRTVGRIRVSAQESWSAENVRGVDDGMAFSPWHGIAAHQPLGSIMRARRATYPKSAAFRSEHNGCPMREP